MTNERFREISLDMSDKLTKQEVKEGWRFCNDCDGLLINLNENECTGICTELK